MGVSVTASMVGIHVGNVAGGIVTIIAALVAVILLSGGRSWRTTDLPAWSMVTMGVLALGSAADSTLGFTTVHLVTWLAGTAAAIVVFVPQSLALVRGRLPCTFPAALPLVTPMVAATNAAQLGHPLPGTICFAASLLTGVPALCLVYLSPGRHPAPPAAATAWIPLGIVGQSATAALLLADSTAYAGTVLALGIPAALWALRVHWGTSLATYSPAWWSCTFPVGTCSLGTHHLALATGAAWLDGVSAALLVLLVLHVALATAGLARQLYVTSTGEWSLQRRS